MSPLRLITLTLGPVALVGALYATTMPDSLQGAIPRSRTRHACEASAKLPAIPHPASTSSDSSDALPVSPAQAGGLDTLCRARAAQLLAPLAPDCQFLVRPPYVLGGDLTETDLDRYHRNVIVPIERALAVSYFDAPPHEPIAILMFAGRESYEQAALALDGRRPSRYSGYYLRGERRIVMNLATGMGTLAHELTHALAHFDFPAMPEWFDEGLAALHEESAFSDDGLQLRGQQNWRLAHLLDALRGGRLQPLDRLVRSGTVRPEHEAVDYAHVRSFCLYLQERQLLGPFYRKLRAGSGSDSTGHATLCELLHVGSLDGAERDFLQWVQRQQPAPGRS